MFWFFLSVAGLGAVLAKMGAYSVWMKVFSIIIMILSGSLIAVLLYILWDKFFRNSSKLKVLPTKWLK